jgi:hypothetical protein
VLDEINKLEARVTELRIFEAEQRRGQLKLGDRTQNILTLAFQEALQRFEAPATTTETVCDGDETDSITFPAKLFSAAEVLQFLGSARKSGAVTFALPIETVIVTLYDGDVINAWSSHTPVGSRLGDLLVSQGSISRERLDQFLALHRGNTRRLGKLLEAEQVVSAEDVSRALRQQMTALFGRVLNCAAVDTVFRAIPVDRDAYDFTAGLVEMLLEGLASSETAKHHARSK